MGKMIASLEHGQDTALREGRGTNWGDSGGEDQTRVGRESYSSGPLRRFAISRAERAWDSGTVCQVEPERIYILQAPVFQPGDPNPNLLTEDEAIRYLRLDLIGIKNPGETLRYYRKEGRLKGTQISKRVFYLREELDRFLNNVTEKNPR
jgi:hypothetical protein